MAATIDDFQNYCLLFILCIISYLILRSFVKMFAANPRVMVRHPPSPPALPIIGHLHYLSPILHKSLQKLAWRFGPLIRLHIGASTCIVASSAAMAKEILKTHDLTFCSRPEFGSSDSNIYKGSRFVTAQYGPYWRFMKKLCMTELLNGSQLNRFLHVRQEEIRKLLESLLKISGEGKLVDMGVQLTTMSNNMICRMAMSTRCSVSDNEAEECRKLVNEALELAGKLSVGDVLGPLKKFDLFGYGKRLGKVLGRFDRLVEGIMLEHEEKRNDGGKEGKDLMDILLEIHQDLNAEVKLRRNDIKSFMFDIFIAGTETSSSAMQWALAELLNHPNVFKKLRDEIDSVIGRSRLVEESDIPNLPYLQAVIKETLRLHPPAPLIIRECTEDCKINGFDVTQETRMLINVFAIMRDPDSWNEPDEFVPERFLVNSKENLGTHQMEMKGQNFHYLPFGSGRRVCPGASLVLNLMHATIGAVVQCFDWKLNNEALDNKVNIEEGSGFTKTMAHPLMCYPVARFNPFSSSL